LLVLADEGRGLGIAEEAGGASRADRLAQLLSRGVAGSGEAWQSDLENEFQVRRYVFGRRLESVPDFESMTFERPSRTWAGP